MPFQVSSDYSIGTAPSSVVAVDLGNGHLDAVTADAGSNTISVAVGNGRGGFSTDVATYPVGSDPDWIASGDFNGDGKPDIVTANAGDDTISVLLGNGSGGFAPAVSYAVGASPHFVAVGDFSNNGKLDIATANYAGDGVLSTAPVLDVFLGNGDGTFQTPWQSTVQSQFWTEASSLAIADFNGDGILDLAVANGYSGYTSIMLGDGDGTFTYSCDVDTFTQAGSIAAGDFNGDGKADLVAVGTSVDAVTQVNVMMGNGDDTFGSPATYYAGRGPGSVQVATLIAGGLPDIVVANADYDNSLGSAESGGVSVLLNIGGGDFSPSTAYGTGAGPVAVAVADFNNDGVPDLITADSAGNDLCLNLGIGDGTFAAPQELPIGITTGSGNSNSLYSWTLSSSGDFNNDGITDLAVLSVNENGTGPNGQGQVSILAGNGNGTFQPAVKTPVGNGIRGLAVGNFDGNGDGVATTNIWDGTISVLEDWSATSGFSTTHTYTVGGLPYSIVAADVNGDGKPDLIVSFWNSAYFDVLLNNGDGTFATPLTFSAPNGTTTMAVADLSGDGKPDLVYASAASNSVSVYLNQGNSAGVWQGFGSPDNTYVYNPSFPVIGDFNGDGNPDIALLSGTSIDLLAGNGDGTVQAPTSIATVPSTATSLIATDLNDDGLPDLITGNSTGNNVSILLNNGSSGSTWNGFAAPYNVGSGSDVYGVAAGDFNRDGLTDLATANYAGLNVTVLTQDAPPANVSADGPYEAVEGSTFNLSAETATHFGGGSLYYEWDFNYDGTTFNPTAVGQTVPFNTSSLASLGISEDTVAVRVTDLAGAAVIATAPLTLSPLAPSGLAVVSNFTNSGQLDNTLSWTNNSAIATDVIVQRFDPTENQWDTILTLATDATSADDIPPDPTQSYEYQVISEAYGTRSLPSGSATPTSPDGTPAGEGPTIVGITTVNFDLVDVDFDDNGNASGHVLTVNYWPNDDTSHVQTATGPFTDNNGGYIIQVRGIALGTIYDFDVADSESTTSGVVPAVCDVPDAAENLTATAASSSQAYLTWTEPESIGLSELARGVDSFPTAVPSIEGYYIADRNHAEDDPTAWTTVAQVFPTSSAGVYSDLISGLTPGDTYDFEVFPFNPQGEASAAETVSATTFAAPRISASLSPAYSLLFTDADPITGLSDTWIPIVNGISQGLYNNSTGTVQSLSAGPFSMTLERHGPHGGQDNLTYYSYAPTIVLTGTAGNDYYLVNNNTSSSTVNNSLYTVYGGNTTIPPVLAPAGINLEINGRGGDDTLEIGSYSMVTLANNVGSDGTVLAVTADAHSTLNLPWGIETGSVSTTGIGASVLYYTPANVASLDSTTDGLAIYHPSISPLPVGDTLDVNWGDGSAISSRVSTLPTPPSLEHTYADVSDTYLVTFTAYNPSGGELFIGPSSVLLTVSITSTASLSLPEPSEYNSSSAALFAGASLPGGTDAFVPPGSASVDPVEGAPAIDQITQTGEPGDVLAVTVEGLSNSTTFWAYGQTNSSNGVFAQAEMITQAAIDTTDGVETDGVASIVLPPTLPAGGVYMIWALNGTEYSPAVVVNQPNITWGSTATAYTGSQVSLFGTNLANNNGQVPYDDQSWVYITNVIPGESAPSTVISDWLPVTAVAPDSTGANAVDVNPYKVDFTLPTIREDLGGGDGSSPYGITPGSYEVYVYNGHGANFGISNAYSLTVAAAPAVTTVTLYDEWVADGDSTGTNFQGAIIPEFLDYPTDSRINPTAVQDALNWLYDTGDYILQLPPGTATIGDGTLANASFVEADFEYGGSLWLPPGITLQGTLNSDGSLATTIEAAPSAGLYAVINATGNDSGLSQLIIKANDGLVAPWTGDSHLVGHDGVIDLGDEYEDSAQNIVDNFTMDHITVDSQNQVAMTVFSTESTIVYAIKADPANVLPDVLGYKNYGETIKNSDFTGQGISFAYAGNEIFDNDAFYGCGASGAQVQLYWSSNISVTRCSDSSLVSDISTQGAAINPDFDSAERFVDLGASDGRLYVADSRTTDLYPIEEVASGSNGGEQILVEESNTYDGNSTESPVEAPSSLFITSFGISDGIATVDTSSLNFLGTGNQIAVISGPGAGEVRTVTGVETISVVGGGTIYVLTLDRPWAVTPTLASELTAGNISNDIVAYQNTLQGDGLGGGVAFAFGVAGTIVDDNDVSDVGRGTNLYNGVPAYAGDGNATNGTVDMFNVYSNNSFSSVGTAVYINADWDPNNVPNQPWFMGNVFRGNIIDAGQGGGGAGNAAIFYVTNFGTNNSSNTAQLLMNVFDSNIITQFTYGFEFGSTSPSGFGGVADQILWNNLGSSEGAVGSAVFYRAMYTFTGFDTYDEDLVPLKNEITNQWQDFYMLYQYDPMP